MSINLEDPGEDSALAMHNPRWFPEGEWVVTTVMPSEIFSLIVYERADGTRILYEEDYADCGGMVVDTEGAQVRDDVLIRDQAALASISDRGITLVWKNPLRNAVCTLEIVSGESGKLTDIDLETAVRIAESVR